MTPTLITLTSNTYGSAIQIGSSGRLSIVPRTNSIWGGGTLVIEQSGNGTNYGRSGIVKENDPEKTRVVTGIVGEYVRVGAENGGSTLSLLVDIISD